MAYLDTSILGSYYCPEPLSNLVNQALLTLDIALISPVGELKFASLLSLKVRTGALNTASATSAWTKFQNHRHMNLFKVVDVGRLEFLLSQRWLTRFNTPLRTLDSIHLCTALINGHELLTTDRLLAKSAMLLGVPHRLVTL